MNSFSELHLPEKLNLALKDMGFETPTPIQAQSIPVALEGKDILACAQTGTGKTAAFAIPMITKMIEDPSVQTLILAPTRELVEQIVDSLEQLTAHIPRARIATVIGGKNYTQQERQLRSNPAFIVATPGRLIDHVARKVFSLQNFKFLILDEADRMLDMGFGPQLDRIVAALPKERQTMLFSATIAPEIKKIALKYMKEPVSIAVSKDTVPLDKIKHSVVKVKHEDKFPTLISEIDKISGSIIVFARTKSRTDKVARTLSKAGHKVTYIHGDRSQNQRSRAIDGFKKGSFRVLVATDIAARGLDIRHIEHVINFDLPMCAEDYIHRIGRTARAGAEGHAMAFVSPQDNHQWSKIHKLMYGKGPSHDVSGERQRSKGDRSERFNSNDRYEARDNKKKRFSDRSERGSKRNDDNFWESFDKEEQNDKPKFERFRDKQRRFEKEARGGFGGKKKSFGDRPFKKDRSEDFSERSFKKKSFGDRPFRKDRSEDFGEKSFGRSKRPFKKKSFGDRPFRKDRSEDFGEKSFGRSERPFKKKSFGGNSFKDDKKFEKPKKYASSNRKPARKDKRHSSSPMNEQESFFARTFGRKPKSKSKKENIEKYL